MSEIVLTALGLSDPRPAPEEGRTPLIAAEVLVVGVDDWSIGEAAALLVAAGRTVHRCSDSVEAPFPCDALVPGRGCPLDKQRVDVVLDVHTRPRSGLPLSEMGAICGLRAGLPLVVGGISDSSILAPWAQQVGLGGGIVATCDAAVSQRALQPLEGDI